ncbi:hypothetical protein ACJX0J_033057, partial [Zea mays]
ITDVCLDENAMSSDPLLAFLLDEVVIKDWCKKAVNALITEIGVQVSSVSCFTISNLICAWASDDAMVIKVDSVNSHDTLLAVVQVIADLNLVIYKAYFSDGSSFMDVFNVTDREGNMTLEADDWYYLEARNTVGIVALEDYTSIDLTGTDPGLLFERGTTESSDLKKGLVNAIQDLYDVVHHEAFSVDMSGHIEDWDQINLARAEGHLFNKLKWPNDPKLKDLIKRFSFTTSLFMEMPVARPVSEMVSFSVFTPYYSEIVLYNMAELQKKNEDGTTTLFYLQKIYPGRRERENRLEERRVRKLILFYQWRHGDWRTEGRSTGLQRGGKARSSRRQQE